MGKFFGEDFQQELVYLIEEKIKEFEFKSVEDMNELASILTGVVNCVAPLSHLQRRHVNSLNKAIMSHINKIYENDMLN